MQAAGRVSLPFSVGDALSCSIGVYADWVAVHQRVALLRAHAQCAVLGAAADDVQQQQLEGEGGGSSDAANDADGGGGLLAVEIVERAHAPYGCVGWG
jgi:hypothetical protein